MKLTEIADVIDFETRRRSRDQARSSQKAADDRAELEQQEGRHTELHNEMSQLIMDYTEKPSMRAPGFDSYEEMAGFAADWVQHTHWGAKMPPAAREYYLPRLKAIAAHAERILPPLRELESKLKAIVDTIPPGTVGRKPAVNLYNMIDKDVSRIMGIERRYRE